RHRPRSGARGLSVTSPDELKRQLLADRVVVLFEPIDDRVAERVIGELLYLEEVDPAREITLSISSPGGSITAGLQILQTVGQLFPPLRTVCVERCGGVATLLIADGVRCSLTARYGERMS